MAYYLEDDRMRAAVQKVVADAIGRAVADGHHDLVVIGHSLGSIVAYDMCSDFTASIRVRLLVTAGSPLGYPIVRRNLRGGAEGVDDRPVPAVLDPIPGTPGRDRVWWLNAFDVLDVVALVHPLASRFSDGGSGSATSARSTRPTRTRSRTTCPTRTSPARSGTCWPEAVARERGVSAPGPRPSGRREYALVMLLLGIILFGMLIGAAAQFVVGRSAKGC